MFISYVYKCWCSQSHIFIKLHPFSCLSNALHISVQWQTGTQSWIGFICGWDHDIHHRIYTAHLEPGILGVAYFLFSFCYLQLDLSRALTLTLLCIHACVCTLYHIFCCLWKFMINKILIAHSIFCYETRYMHNNEGFPSSIHSFSCGESCSTLRLI